MKCFLHSRCVIYYVGSPAAKQSPGQLMFGVMGYIGMCYIGMCRRIGYGFEVFGPYMGHHFCSFWHCVSGVILNRVPKFYQRK